MNGFPQLLGYDITESLYAGSRTLVYRAVRENDSHPVVIKLMRNLFPSFRELVQFRNQYEIAKNIDLSKVIKIIALEPYGNGYALVMEDFGGISLENLLTRKGNLSKNAETLTEFLEIAIQIAEALDGLYHYRVIHKDIKPANILIHPDKKQVKLIDFSISSQLLHETQEIQNINALEGTLSYLSPEQTGRMNRCIDYRSDFYSLGVTFYELLTGQLPFVSDDQMELVHCHLAKSPVPMHQINPEIPLVLSNIVGKLMAKNAEDRYQSALGLKYDLEIALHQLNQTETIQLFEIARRDLRDRFTIPEKLYGREVEIQTLLNAFERVSQGFPEIMLVGGFSGIGKTSVVNEVHKPIVRQRGYFIKGKYEQFQRNIPFFAIVQAFRDLMGQVLAESDTKLQAWKAEILEAIGENGQVLIEVIPELEYIIGVQPPTPELSGNASQNRFNLLFQKFVQVFTTADHPLVLFLDDLQWADLASLKLLQLLIPDAGHLLVLCAYRDNEVSPEHPFMLAVDEIVKSGATVNTITLQSLIEVDLNQLVADTLLCDLPIAKPLTELIYQKTKGNPFFSTQLLKTLYDDKQITFNLDVRYWQCDIDRARLTYADDVVEFMARQMQKLPLVTQDVLKVAACIGAQFDLQTLAIASQKSVEYIAAALWQASQEGLIIPTTEAYKAFSGSDPNSILQLDANATYKFLHDRVQQAAYSLIPDAQKQATHYQIGQLLLQQISSKAGEDSIFELVNQLNYGTALITDQIERDRLALLNLTACRKARTASAYQAAQEYAKVGLSLLGNDTWQRQYEMTLSLYELAAEISSICGAFEQMEQYIDIVTEQAHSLLEKINVCRIRIQANISQNKLIEAIEIAKQILQDIDVNFPETVSQKDIQHEYEEIRKLIGAREIKDLSALPMMTDEKKIAIVQIASSIYSAAYFSGSPLLPLLISLSVRLSIQYGYTLASAYSYAFYGIILCSFLQDVDSAVEFGQLAFHCVSKDDKSTKPEVLLILAVNILHRKAHTREMLPLFREGYAIGLEVGNIEFAGYGANMSCLSSFWMGLPLASLEQDTRAYFNELVKFNQLTSANYCRIYWQTILNLFSFADYPSILTGEALQEVEFLSQSKSTVDGYGLCLFYWHKLMLCYLFGEIDQAQNYAFEARRYLIAAAGNVVEPAFYFYDSLIALAKLSQPLDLQSEAWQKIVQTQTLLQQQWAHYAPMNHQHKVDLVEAEKCRVLGRNYEAGDWYDRAISGAKENGYIQEEALANELAAKFYLEWGKEKIAQVYMLEAYYGYVRWGANAKVFDLERRYPQLLQAILLHPQTTSLPISINNSSTQPSGAKVSEVLDFASAIKAAQVISSEIQLDELLKKLTQIILQNSGGNKCLLIFPEDGKCLIKAISTIETSELCALSLNESLEAPIKLIQYVKRKQLPIAIDNLKTDLPIIDDYLTQRQPKSILCLPILNQGHLAGILYLENQSTAGVFTSDRLEVLNLLCAQAAISLENALLYQQMQQSTGDLKRSLVELQSSQISLQRSESTNRAIIEAIPDLLMRVNRDGIYQNIAGFEHLNVVNTEQFCVGSSIYDSLPFDKARQRMQAVQQALETGEIQIYEQSFVAHSRVQYEEVRIAVCNQNEVLIIARDITDRKVAESQLKLQALQLELVNQQLSDYSQTLEDKVEERTQQLNHQMSALLDLTCDKSLSQGNWQQAVRQLTKAGAETLGVERASVWLYDASKTKIVCANLFEVITQQHSSGTELLAANYPNYFRAMETDRSIVANCARTDTRTREFADSYLEPLGITSMLDAPIRLGERTIGVLCLERIGSTKEWTLEEQSFARSLSDLIALAFESRQRKQVEIALQQLNGELESRVQQRTQELQKLNTILEAASDYISIADPQGKSLWLNQQFKQLLPDLTDADIRQLQLFDFYPQWAKELVINQGIPTAMKHGTWLGETAILAPTGREIPVSQLIIAHKSANGEVEYFSTIVRDISDRKAAEVQLQQQSEQLEQANQLLAEYSQNLEQKVEDRTNALKVAQQQLIAQEKLASLGTLTAGIAHELRNPLNFVTNFARGSIELSQDLLETIQPLLSSLELDISEFVETLIDDIQENATTIRAHAQRAENIIANMMQHARTDNAKADPQPTQINDLLDQSLKLAYHSKKMQDSNFNLAIQTNYADDLALVDIVQGAMSRAFINLIDNACDAMRFQQVKFKDDSSKDYQPTLNISTCNLGDRVEIRIGDNGCGVAPEIQAKILDPFFTTKPPGEGTGLGLSLTHDIIVKQHQGTLMINSNMTNASQTTEIIVTIPYS
ncbi:MAG: hypothetical protein DCF20_16620 [Pseudanabaena sp.]|nr:MAG: hypothetical protein DCF20_16620 [Pseudanabaena sp.]